MSGPGTAKDIRHIVVNLAGSGLHYKAGDSLGVYPANRIGEIEKALKSLGATGDELVTPVRSVQPVRLRTALIQEVDLDSPTRKMVETVVARLTDATQRDRLNALLAPEAKDQLTLFLEEHSCVDLLAEFPTARLEPSEFVGMLRRLTPRLYSIASSPKCFPDEAHLTVAAVRYQINGRERQGVCSTFLADRITLEYDAVPVFVSHSHFAPPDDHSKDCIMIGPGTGIAPFRAFVQDRTAMNAAGRNWLFFGDQRRTSDFLYEDEWLECLANGKLARLDLAWSRDQAHKIYVQDKMRENAAELWSWIKAGAFFYVCGDAKRMAKDVDAALHDIIIQHGCMDSVAAVGFVKQMKSEKRYQRDVY